MKVGSEIEYNTGDRRKTGELLGIYSDNFDRFILILVFLTPIN